MEIGCVEQRSPNSSSKRVGALRSRGTRARPRHRPSGLAVAELLASGEYATGHNWEGGMMVEQMLPCRFRSASRYSKSLTLKPCPRRTWRPSRSVVKGAFCCDGHRPIWLQRTRQPRHRCSWLLARQGRALRLRSSLGWLLVWCLRGRHIRRVLALC